jgi:hypothetical protein
VIFLTYDVRQMNSVCLCPLIIPLYGERRDKVLILKPTIEKLSEGDEGMSSVSWVPIDFD